MEIKKVGSQPSAKGSSEWFTGTVRVDPLFHAPDPARVSGASVWVISPSFVAPGQWGNHPIAGGRAD
jgi:hypothetical protein